MAVKRPYRTSRNRSKLPRGFLLSGPAVVATITLVATKARFTCNLPVSIGSIPLGITRQAAGSGPQLEPTAVTQISANVFDLTYAASVVATDKITIPAAVQEVLGVAGGQLAAQTVTL